MTVYIDSTVTYGNDEMISVPEYDDIFVSRSGYVRATSTDDPVVRMRGNCALTVAGAIVGDYTLVEGRADGANDTVLANIHVLSGGSLSSFGNYVINLTIGAGIGHVGSDIRNDGTISGNYGVVLFGNPLHHVVNTGIISTYANGIRTSGTVDNSGTISASGSAFYGAAVYSFGAQIINSGTISAAAGLAVQLGPETLLINTGTISGSLGKLYQGAVLGNYLGEDVLNSGTITGDVEMGEGNDSVDSSAGRIIGTLAGGAGADTLIGGASADTIQGGAGADLMDGGAGFDMLDYAKNGTGVRISLLDRFGGGGDAEGDNYKNFEGIIGSALADSLTGNGSDNRLAGGAGNDTVAGGAGGDDLDGGADFNTLDYRASTAAITIDLARGTGSGGHAEADYFVNFQSALGSAYADRLTGSGSGDRLDGSAGNDTLAGLDGLDTLVGGTGSDSMIGGLGNDLFVIDSSGDRAVEAAGGGSDTVQSAVSYSGAGQYVEEIRLTGSAGLSADGQSLANVLAGNSGANRLYGAGGDDTLKGGLGNDTLAGGTGDDIFGFDSRPNASSNHDLIVGFDPGDDRIRLENGIFTGLAAGALPSSAFAANTSGTATSTAHRIVYETDTGNLYFDANGSAAGGSVLFATLDNKAAIGASDFLVI